MERGSWNRQAWINFLETYAVGTGLGSSRASSFPLVLLSNVGAIGTYVFVAFLSSLFRKSPYEQQMTHDIRSGAQQAVLASLVAATVSATVFDLGVAFYLFAAAASRQPQEEPKPLEARVWSHAPA
jgi:hypothetical protein